MRNTYRLMIGMAAMAMASGIAAATAMQQVEKETGLNFQKAQRHRGKGQNTLRGRGKVSKPRKRTNRQIISKRVRRKHRRSARG